MTVLGRFARLAAAFKVVTPLGVSVALVGLVAWIAGAVFGWREFLIVAGVCLVLLAVAALCTIGRADLETIVRVEPSRVVVGERSSGELILKNRRRRSVRGLRVELPVGRATATFSVPHLKAGEVTDELFVVPTNRRAIIPVGPVVSIKGDPLGLARRTQQWGEMEEIYVHPKTVRLSTVTAGLIRDLEGVTTSALSPSDIAFHTLRDYVAGDDLRHVHWKSSAKAGDLLVRQYNDTRRSHVAVLLSRDLDEYASEDEFELAVSCAASVAVQAMRDEQTLTMIVGGEQFPIHNATRLLDRFSGIEPTRGAQGVEAALKLTRRIASDASVAILAVGSVVGVNEIRLATSRAGVQVSTVSLHAEIGCALRYLSVGGNRFVSVPDLDSLNRGFTAVVAA